MNRGGRIIETPKVKKRLTDNQRRTLTELLERHDAMILQLIENAKETTDMRSVSDKLTTNMDFKKKVVSLWDRLRAACIKQGVYLDLFEDAVKEGTKCGLDDIVAGQPRENLRWNLNCARCSFLYMLCQDEMNVNFGFDPKYDPILWERAAITTP